MEDYKTGKYIIKLQTSGERRNSEKSFSPHFAFMKDLTKWPQTRFLSIVSLSYWLMVADQLKLCHLNNYQVMSYYKIWRQTRVKVWLHH